MPDTTTGSSEEEEEVTAEEIRQEEKEEQQKEADTQNRQDQLKKREHRNANAVGSGRAGDAGEQLAHRVGAAGDEGGAQKEIETPDPLRPAQGLFPGAGKGGDQLPDQQERTHGEQGDQEGRGRGIAGVGLFAEEDHQPPQGR